VGAELHFLGVDGGGTQCRARLCDGSGVTLAEGTAGPANIRLGVHDSFRAVLDATAQCLVKAKLTIEKSSIVACLALAGATEPIQLEKVKQRHHPFRQLMVTTDAHAACVGAHGGKDGGVIIIGTGTIAWATLAGRHYRIGGWGFPISDEGSGAWLGCEAVRRVLWAHDGRAPWTPLLHNIFDRFACDAHAVVRWMSLAKPREFAELAPLVVEHALEDDSMGSELMQLAASHVEMLANRLDAIGVRRWALVGGLSVPMGKWIGPKTRRWLVPAVADALTGAVWLAREDARLAALADN